MRCRADLCQKWLFSWRSPPGGREGLGMSQDGGGEGVGGAGAGREGWAPLSRALSPLHSSEGGGDRDFPGPRYDRGPPLYLKESNTSLSLIYFLQLLHPVSISHCQCLVGHPVHSANSQFLVLTIMISNPMLYII